MVYSSEERDFRETLAALQRGDWDAATAIARQALLNGAQNALFFDVRGRWFEQHGMPAAALLDFERAYAQAPKNHSLACSLVRVLLSLGRTAEALARADRLVEIAPSHADARYTAGLAHEHAGDVAEAQMLYEIALRLDPRFADALARLAALAARRSDWPRARDAAARALALVPGHTGATLTIAAIDLEQDDPTTAKQHLEPLLKKQTASPLELSSAYTLLGDALDLEDDTAEAFNAYTRAGQILQSHGAQAYAEESSEPMPALVRRVAAFIGRTSPAVWARAAGEERQSVFLLGFLRTGTTLLGQVLACHEAISTMDEVPALQHAIETFIGPADGLDRLLAADDALLQNERRIYWERVENASGPASRIVIDKMPLNTINLPIIARLFPGAKIVFAVRDPRDVVFSCFRRPFALNRSTYELLTLEGAARYYSAVMRLADLAQDKLLLSFKVVRNEDLIADFESETQALCRFLEIAWRPQLKDFAERAKTAAIATPSSTQIARGLNSGGIGQWRRYRKEMSPVLPDLAPWVKKFGYPED